MGNWAGLTICQAICQARLVKSYGRLVNSYRQPVKPYGQALPAVRFDWPAVRFDWPAVRFDLPGLSNRTAGPGPGRGRQKVTKTYGPCQNVRGACLWRILDIKSSKNSKLQEQRGTKSNQTVTKTYGRKSVQKKAQRILGLTNGS